MTTESVFPFPGQGNAVGAHVEEAVSGGSDRRKLLIAGAAVLAVLLAAGYFLLLQGGSDTTATGPVVQHRTPAAAAKAKAATAKAPAKQTIPQTFDGTVGRDPFKPLVEPPPPAPVAVTPPAGTAGTVPTSTTTASQPVALQKVYKANGKSYAQLTINGAVYAPAVGQAFAQTFQLLSISGHTATLVQGDEQFSLKVGQVVTR